MRDSYIVPDQSRAKHDLSPPWPCQGRESWYFLTGFHIAGQALPGPATPCDALRPYDYPVSPRPALPLPGGLSAYPEGSALPAVGRVLPRGPSKTRRTLRISTQPAR